MRRAMVLIAAGAVALAAGVVGFTVGRTRSVPQPVETTLPAKVAQPEVGSHRRQTKFSVDAAVNVPWRFRISHGGRQTFCPSG